MLRLRRPLARTTSFSLLWRFSRLLASLSLPLALVGNNKRPEMLNGHVEVEMSSNGLKWCCVGDTDTGLPHGNTANVLCTVNKHKVNVFPNWPFFKKLQMFQFHVRATSLLDRQQHIDLRTCDWNSGFTGALICLFPPSLLVLNNVWCDLRVLRNEVGCFDHTAAALYMYSSCNSHVHKRRQIMAG